jgi:hypothetical protein
VYTVFIVEEFCTRLLRFSMSSSSPLIVDKLT